MILVPLLAAVWLIAAPFLFDFTAFALWSSIAAGVLAGGLSLLGTLGSLRFYGVAAVGVYLVVAGLFFLSGAALWSCAIAGAVLTVAGIVGALQEEAPQVRAGA